MNNLEHFLGRATPMRVISHVMVILALHLKPTAQYYSNEGWFHLKLHVQQRPMS